MRALLLTSLCLAVFAAAACNRELPATAAAAEEIEAPPLRGPVAAGEVVYVPAYTRVHHVKMKDRTANLVTTLAIHNTDMQAALVVRSVDYYAESGKLIRRFVQKPRLLPPLATAIYYLAPDEHSKAGIGANAIVEWVSEQKIARPLIEAIMVSSDNNLGISFVSPGYPVKDLAKSR